ncbi:hypothetical protein SKAU_G00147030 [Synaphobranchus kaupii]|uniref:Uncharacterized protein n=1 Tax=Synaphobranchus kaupii TaxID=118154 RepID=A0A9Q1FTG9_SYNKA|nr:hypothetical protein SKAU_G00147030 [Synaphobranchus kaupii]
MTAALAHGEPAVTRPGACLGRRSREDHGVPRRNAADRPEQVYRCPYHKQGGTMRLNPIVLIGWPQNQAKNTLDLAKLRDGERTPIAPRKNTSKGLYDDGEAQT